MNDGNKASQHKWFFIKDNFLLYPCVYVDLQMHVLTVLSLQGDMFSFTFDNAEARRRKYEWLGDRSFDLGVQNLKKNAGSLI